jgi:tryptophan-rich sensory protein
LVSNIDKPSFNLQIDFCASVEYAIYNDGIAAGPVWDRIDFEKEIVKKALIVFAYNWR